MIVKVTPFDMPVKGQALSVLVLSDIHSEHIDLDAFNTIKRFFEKTPKKRRRIVLLGDIMDFAAFMDKNPAYKLAMKNHDWDTFFVEEAKKEYEWFEWLLSELKSLVDYSNIWYVEGNHEQRLRRPKFTAHIPHEYKPWFDLPFKLRFEERGIKFIQYNDWILISTKGGDLKLTHGVYCGANPIKKHVDVAHCSVMFGHTHERGVRSFKNIEQTFMGFNNPCLCGTEPMYLEGKPHNWSVGFSTIQITHENFWVNQYTLYDGVLYDTHGRLI